MTSYTNDWGLPKPDSSDLIAGSTDNLRRDIGRLADKTDQSLTQAKAQAEQYADRATEGVAWVRGDLPSGTNPDTMIDAQSRGLWTVLTWGTYPGLPVSNGSLLVEPTANSVKHTATSASGASSYERTAFISGSSITWGAWVPAKQVSYPSGVPLDELRNHGDYILNTDVDASGIPDWPTSLLSPRASVVRVRVGSTGLTRQTIEPLFRDNVLATRVTQTISSSPFPFTDWKIVGDNGGSDSPVASDAGLANALLKEDFSRRYGGRISTGGRGAVALRCDHGLANFRDLVLPLCEAAGIVPSQALNSRSWGLSENAGVTPEIVNGWVEDGKVEVWNHSASHTNPANLPRLEEEIITGLQELRDQLPAANIDGWVIPGVGAPEQYMGMGTGTRIQQYYESVAGRMILQHHAVATGHIPGTHQRILDGTIRQSQLHFGMDSRTPAEIIPEIDYAIANKTGLQLMIHPSVINDTGRITATQLAEVIDYITTKEQAGELMALSPYELMIADSTS